MLPSTSIASLPDVAGNPRHIDNPFLWIASNFVMFSVGVINQTVDMFKATKEDIKLIEPEVTYKAGVDVMMMRAPSYWSRLGSSK
jgi:hypothetical protein